MVRIFNLHGNGSRGCEVRSLRVPSCNRKLVSQSVLLAVPPKRIVEPGPGLDGTKLLPVIRNVMPPAAAPAVALDGESERIAADLINVDRRGAGWLASSTLVATTLSVLDEGA